MIASKNLAKKVLINTGVLHLAGQLASRSIAVLKYHSVQDEPELFDDSIGISIIHKTSVFKEQMEIVAGQFNPVSMNDVLLFLRGEKDISNESVAVTFDDGFADNFEIAAPILDYYGIRATFYITVNSIENNLPPWFLRIRHALWTTEKQEWLFSPNNELLNIRNREERLESMRLVSKYCANLVGDFQESAVREIEQSLNVDSFVPRNGIMMNWEQIRKLHRSGHIIGSHTLYHANVAHLDRDILYRELTDSKSRIEKELGSEVIHFSYPNPALHPHLNDLTTEALVKTGYRTAVISTPAGMIDSRSNPYLLKRVWVPGTKSEFLWHLEWSRLGRKM